MTRRGWLGALLALGSTQGCVNEVAITQDAWQSSARAQFNREKRGCMLPEASVACYDLGRDALHVTAQTKAMTWTEPMDAAMAHTAWVRGCANGWGKACAALVEYDLASDPRERAWAVRRAVLLYNAVRSTAAVSDEQRAAQDKADDMDAKYQQDLAEAAQRDAESRARAVDAFSTAAQYAPSMIVTPPSLTRTPLAPPPSAPPPRPPAATNRATPQERREAQLERDVALEKQQQQQAQQQTDAANAAAAAEQKRKANLAACLATDLSCPGGSYGTSSSCVPSVAYTDRFGNRGVVDRARMQAQMYAGPDMGPPWVAEYTNNVAPILDQANLPPMVEIMGQFVARKNALSSAVLVGYPSCSAPDSSTDQLKFWCSNRHADCLTQTTKAEQELDCARQQDQFLYYAEAKQHGIDAQQKHDADCHTQFGY